MDWLKSIFRSSESGRVESWITDDDHYCRALVADDGKILSVIDYWYRTHPISNKLEAWQGLKSTTPIRTIKNVSGQLYLDSDKGTRYELSGHERREQSNRV